MNRFYLLILTSFTLIHPGCKSSTTTSSLMESEEKKNGAFAEFPNALYPVLMDDRWGYMNRKGELVIQPIFQHAEDFRASVAIASVLEKDKELFGYIDTRGNWLIKPQFERASPFYENKAAVKKDERFGYIDLNGNEVITFQFEDAGNFSEHRAAVKKEGWVGFIDESGTMVIEPKFTCAVSHPVFVNGLAPVFGPDEKTGFINPQGEWVIEAKFESAGKFSEGKAWAMMMETDAAATHGFTIKGGYINTKGEYVISPGYDFGWDFSEGCATVWKISDDKKQKLWSVINATGQTVLKDLMYRNVGAMSNGLIPIQNEDMQWGFIDITGKEIIKPSYTGVNHFTNGLTRMELGSAFAPKPVYINRDGEHVVPVK